MNNKVYDENAFKEITENPIILDFTNCKYCGTIHKILKEKFGLPEYYGENWSALWDCLSYLWFHDEEILVQIYGFYTMDNELQKYCEKMLEIFRRVHDETPNVTFEIIS